MGLANNNERLQFLYYSTFTAIINMKHMQDMLMQKKIKYCKSVIFHLNQTSFCHFSHTYMGLTLNCP